MKIKYIPDQEINLNREDLLGTKPYVSALKEIITESHTPFTVGLLGGWGIGKSSIIRTIQDDFNKSKESKTKVFIYDAWKYSHDSFRRTFILKLKSFFKLDEDEQYETFYHDKHEDIGHKNQIDGEKTAMGLLYLLPLLLLLVWVLPMASTEIRVVVSILSAISTILLYFLKDIYVQYKISISKPRTFAPEQFEAAFTDAIAKITHQESHLTKALKWFKIGSGTVHAEKVVIVIDNIDRCHKKLAFELLLTVKSFLDSTNVIFIIPVDDKEIKKHITDEKQDGNEFLRKLFNTTITVKKITEGDLFEFAKSLNDKYSLKLPVDVLSIVSQEFSKNPRKIIQFLNVLQTELLIAEHQEKDLKILPQKTITENTTFYTKLLIIREEWHELYSYIKDTPFVLNNLHQYFSSDSSPLNLTKEQERFLKRTEHIKANHNRFELFFNNKDSFHNIPDSTYNYVLSNDYDSIMDQMDKGELTLDGLIEFIDSKFELAINRGEIKTTIFNLLSLLFKLTTDSKTKSDLGKYWQGSTKFLGGVKNYINTPTNDLNSNIRDLSSNDMMTFIKENSSHYRSFKNSVVKTINTEKELKNNDLIKSFILFFKENANDLKSVSSKFTAIINEDFSVVNEFKEVLDETDVIENLLEASVIEKFMNEVNNNIDDEDNIAKITLISKYKASENLDGNKFNPYVNKLVTYVTSANDFKTAPFWLKKLTPLIAYIDGDKTLKDTNTQLINKAQWFHNSYNQLWKKPDYRGSLFTLLDCLKELYSVINEPSINKQQTDWLFNFFSRNELPELIEYITNIYMSIVEEFEVYTWGFSQHIIDKYVQVDSWELKCKAADILNLMIEKTNEEKGLNNNQIKSIYQNYISSIDGDNKDIVIKWISGSLGTDKTKELFKETINTLSIDEKLEIVVILKELDEKELIEAIVDEIFEAVNYDDFEDTVSRLKESGISTPTIQKSVKSSLRGVNNDDADFKSCISAITESNISDKVIENLIAEKMIPLLASDNETEKMYALRIINKIEITDSRKRDAVKGLVQNIDKELLDEHGNQLLTNLTKKLK